MKEREGFLLGNGDVRIVYDVYEPTDSPRGTVLISHGLGEHGGRYAHVARRLATAGFVAAVPDHRGHGRSAGRRAGCTRFHDYTDDLHAVAAAVSVVGLPVFALGHSMGGTIALEYALQYGAELHGLILSGAAVQPGAQPRILLEVAKLLSRVAPGLPTAKLETAAISRDPEVVAAYTADPMVFHGKVPAGLAGGMLRIMDTFPSRVPQLALPLLVMHGGDDRLTSPDGTRLVHRLAGSADKQITIYEGLYHEIFNEPEQDVVLDDVERWLVAHV